MGLIPQTKCSRCDRTYSGLRSRCPYCGASRSKRGKRVSDGDNATWKLIIGVLLIVVLIAAVVVILVTGSNDDTPGGNTNPGGADVNNPPVDDEPGKNPEGNPDPTKPAEVQVKNAAGETIATLTLKKDETIDLTAVISPDTATGVPVWTSSNSAAVGIMALDTTGMSYRLTGLSAGSSTVTVIVDTVKYEFTVQVTEDGAAPGGDTPGGTGTTTPGGTIATNVQIRTMYGDILDDISLQYVGETCDLYAVITPSTVTSVPTWTNTNPAAVEMVPVDETGMIVRVTGMAYGVSIVTCTVDGVSFEMTVRCNG